MRSYPKKTKRLIREYATEAYERELHRELSVVDENFSEWRTGQISSGELSHRLHKYETGPSRDLFKQYNYGEADMNVAYAIVAEILAKDEMPPELLEALAHLINFYQGMKDRDELKLPG